MEEKKLDIKSIIGFVLIFGILLFMMWQNKPTPEELAAEEKAKQEQIDAAKAKEAQQEDTKVVAAQDFSNIKDGDSLQQIALQNKLGAFAYAASLTSKEETIVDNGVLQLKFSSKGGQLSEVKLSNFVDYDSIPIYLVKENNASFNINFGTTDNRIQNTKDLPFQPSVSKSGENTIVSMKLKVSESKFLEYKYIVKPNDYMIEFFVQSQGLTNVINGSQEVNLSWEHKAYRHAKSISYENRYTDLHYDYQDGKDDYTGARGAEEELEDVAWIGYKQHFFSSILLTDTRFKTAYLKAENLVEDEDIDTVYTKNFASKIPLELKGGEISQSMDWYYGPNDYDILKAYDRNLDKVVPFGWGIFGWINQYLFTPLFGFLRMKILKPELDSIREKYKDNKMKAQQETIALQNKAGASPLAGCLPALIQMPVFYALFMFFPSAFGLRQKGFLWANDLSSFDSIYDFPGGFSIPLYGDHISLFPILAAVAIFFYMKLTTGQNQMSAPQQEGMPDMAKMMKYMIYFAPIMMMVFFNQYASGLSLYYFISNLISIGILIVIKNFILDEKKILAGIEASKAKPKKENKFQKRMKNMMEQAEKQKRMQEQQRKKK